MMVIVARKMRSKRRITALYRGTGASPVKMGEVAHATKTPSRHFHFFLVNPSPTG